MGGELAAPVIPVATRNPQGRPLLVHPRKPNDLPAAAPRLL